MSKKWTIPFRKGKLGREGGERGKREGREQLKLTTSEIFTGSTHNRREQITAPQALCKRKNFNNMDMQIAPDMLID